MTVGVWGERWLAAAKAHLKIKTSAGYDLLFKTKIRPTFGDENLAAVKPMMVSEWVAALHAQGLSASRVRQSYRLLSQIMRSAVDNGLIEVTPCRGVRLPRMPITEPHILTQEEAERIIANARAPHDLRASHATWVAESHGAMAAAQRLGHAHASVTTRHYARAMPGRDAEVAAALDAVRAPADTKGQRPIGHATGTPPPRRRTNGPEVGI